MSLLLGSAGLMKLPADAGFTPQWVQFPASGFANLSRTSTIGSSGAVQMFRAYTFDTPDFTHGGFVLGNSASIDTPWKDSMGSGFSLVDVEDETDARCFYAGSNALSANTQYLMLAYYDGTQSAQAGAIVYINIATGAITTPTPVTVKTDGAANVTMDFGLANWVIGSATIAGGSPYRGKLERIQQWTGVAPDVTSSTIQDYFYDSTGNALLDPAVAKANIGGTMLCDVSGADILSGDDTVLGASAWTVTGTLT